MATPRRSPPVNLTLTPAVLADLDALAAEDAAEEGRDPRRQRSATVAALVVAEKKRRAKRAQKKETEGT